MLPLKILGIEIGTFEGWDQVDETTYHHYSFVPNSQFEKVLPAGDLSFDWVEGNFSSFVNEKIQVIPCSVLFKICQCP